MAAVIKPLVRLRIRRNISCHVHVGNSYTESSRESMRRANTTQDGAFNDVRPGNAL